MQTRNWPFKVAKSPVHNNGVFTIKDLNKNEFVGFYTGKEYTQQDYENNKDDIQNSWYLMQVGTSKNLYYIDANDLYNTNHTRYINSATTKKELNCNIVYMRDPKNYKKLVAAIFTTKKIKANSELFLNYGSDYTELMLGKIF